MGIFDPDEVITEYSLKQAIEDGVLVEILKNKWGELRGRPYKAVERRRKEGRVVAFGLPLERPCGAVAEACGCKLPAGGPASGVEGEVRKPRLEAVAHQSLSGTSCMSPYFGAGSLRRAGYRMSVP